MLKKFTQLFKKHEETNASTSEDDFSVSSEVSEEEDQDAASSLVFDNGSCHITAGFAGGNPRTVFRNHVGHKKTEPSGKLYVGCEIKETEFDDYDLLRPIQRGIVQNWDDLEKIWNHTFYNELRAAPEEHHVFHSVSNYWSSADKEKLGEIMFETFNVPSFFVLDDATLATLELAKSSSLSLICGEDRIRCVPVYQSSPLLRSMRTAEFGGLNLTNYTQQLLQDQLPNASIRLAEEVKRQAIVPLNFEEQLREHKTYQLDDGQVIQVNDAIVRCGEALFQPSLFGSDQPSITKLVLSSLAACNQEIQSDLMSVVISGQTSFQGIAERLQNELARSYPKMRVYANPERRYAVWIGGSIVASTKMWKDLRVKREEYDEYGSNIVTRKCMM
jgi:actin